MINHEYKIKERWVRACCCPSVDIMLLLVFDFGGMAGLAGWQAGTFWMGWGDQRSFYGWMTVLEMLIEGSMISVHRMVGSSRIRTLLVKLLFLLCLLESADQNKTKKQTNKQNT